MNDEAFKTPHPEHHSGFEPGSIHPLSKLEATTVFGRFVKKVSLIFSKTQQVSDLKLSGRIYELRTIANLVLFEILDFKNEIKEKTDPALFFLISTIIDPLIKEIGREFPVIEKTDNTVKQVKAFSHYVDSIEKARIWIQIGKDHKTKETLEHGLIQQTAKEFLSRIDRDIQILQDYLSHTVDSLEVSDVLNKELNETLKPWLSSKMDELHGLKNIPADFSLDSFMQWRSNADCNREILFSEILHIIDSFSYEFLPSAKKEIDGENAKMILNQIHSLEERFNKISVEIDGVERMEENQRKNYQLMLERLEEEAHQLNANLQLSHEHSERIEKFLEILFKLQKQLKSS